MTNISVPRPLLERLANSRAFLHDTRKAQDELRTLLAQPAAQVTGEVCEPANRLGELLVIACAVLKDTGHPKLAARIDAALAEPVSADPMAMLDLRVEARKASPWGEHADRTGAFVKGALWHAMLNGGAVAERDAKAREVKL